jgi:hypothetical protein
MSELYRLAEPSPNHKVSLMRAGYGQCRFLVTEHPARPLCCGAPTLGEGSWCPWHRRVVYARPHPALLRAGAGDRDGFSATSGT